MWFSAKPSGRSCFTTLRIYAQALGGKAQISQGGGGSQPRGVGGDVHRGAESAFLELRISEARRFIMARFQCVGFHELIRSGFELYTARV